MKRLFLMALLGAVIFALVLPSCKPNQQETPAAPPGSQGGPALPAPTTPGSHTEGGYLSGPGASYTFTVNAGSNNFLEVPFTYPKGQASFWVRVVGQDGSTVLGDFDLDKGEVVQLMGGGTFYLTVYSKTGAGNWSAKY
jgi:hypothetical protein